MDASIIAGGLKLLGSIGGKKEDSWEATRNSIFGKAEGARRAGAKYGFNPLTLLQGAASLGGGPVSGPPLASLAVLGDLIEEKYGEEATTRREHNRLQNELLRLEVDRVRSLGAVAPPSAVGGATLNGGYAVGVTQSPVSGAPFLDEDDRGTAFVDERDNTVSFQSHGQETVVPVGPDMDEVLTGVFIDNANRKKASRERLARAGGWTVGTPLAVPPMPLVSGLGGGVSAPDFSAVMPPKKKPKYGWPIGPDLPFNTRQKFPWE